uniref:Uncharacterized protein n=1 Tax=Picea sitchensis TaxID=3332 RepID=A0A6B9XPS3_PICSI|nr:hypothetical protein Q903MT_gene3992 [Picea sitchensis]
MLILKEKSISFLFLITPRTLYPATGRRTELTLSYLQTEGWAGLLRPISRSHSVISRGQGDFTRSLQSSSRAEYSSACLLLACLTFVIRLSHRRIAACQ